MDAIELLAPAGSFETALAAFESGADAVYLGLDAFSARAQAVNFSFGELADLMMYARAKGRKVYITFNTLLTDAELEDAVERLQVLDELSPDALIVQDIGVVRVLRRHFPSLPIHASTQLVAHNLEGVLALKELGFSRVVLARELPIEDIRSIVKRCGCEIEVFVHGALCYSISGLCLFSAMERRRSGNRGRCAYCCRLPYSDSFGGKSLPFSMKDLRLDDRLDALREAGVASLKIEGRMKSSLYVSSVVKRYREILDGVSPTTSRDDLETVFSRSTTHLYADGWKQNVSELIDNANLGHQGTPIGTVKRITKDREGRSWLRFHTTRAIEKHDGLQFVSLRNREIAGDARPIGMGIGEMRLAISRKPVFVAHAGSDVEVEVKDPLLLEELSNPEIMPVEVRCSMSNEVKRRFPIPSFRSSDYSGLNKLDVKVSISDRDVCACACGETAHVELPSAEKANRPEMTFGAVRKCFSKLGGTVWSLSSIEVDDPQGLYVPVSLLNELRRELVAKLDESRIDRRAEKIASVKEAMEEDSSETAVSDLQRVLKVRLGQSVPPGKWDETVVMIGHSGDVPEFADDVRLALPVFTKESDYSRFRARVKNLIRSGYVKWEAADLAGIRMLKSLGVEDITADWTVYSFNAQAIRMLAELGVRRCVLSPEADQRDIPQSFAVPVERIVQQSTPLFISVTKPASEDSSLLMDAKGGEFASFQVDGLWVTTRMAARVFPASSNAISRIDLSWDPEV
ncbi:MAG: U32 family peptidase [Kiritimatiellae bacterium]|nr:U32 family peptidase [Kiritimatiellia bacterium]